MQDRDHVALVLSESHKTVDNIKARGAFTKKVFEEKGEFIVVGVPCKVIREITEKDKTGFLQSMV